MTIQELIARLTMFDPDAEIMVSGPDLLADIEDIFGDSKEVLIHCKRDESDVYSS